MLPFVCIPLSGVAIPEALGVIPSPRIMQVFYSLLTEYAISVMSAKDCAVVIGGVQLHDFTLSSPVPAQS